MIKRRYILILVFFLICNGILKAQSFSLVLNEFDFGSDSLITSSTYSELDSLNVYSILDSVYNSSIYLGYLSTSIDSIKLVDSTYYASFKRGDLFYWEILNSNSDTVVSNELDGNIVSELNLKNILEDELKYHESKGYPLAKYNVNDPVIANQSVGISIKLDTFHQILFDTIELKGNTNLSYDFIAQFLNIYKGDVYSKDKLRAISDKIKQLDFVILKDTPKIVFFGYRAKIVLNFEQTKNNIFDFLIGVLPQSGEDKGKWLITGDLTLSLYNKIGYGEQLYFHFKRYKASSQELNLNLVIPYIANLPFGVRTKLKILKDVDKYITIDSKIGLQYRNGYRNFYLDWNYYDSRLLEIDTTSILSAGRLPNELDFVLNGVTIGIDDIRLDHKTNPRIGFEYDFEFGIGNKRTIINDKIVQLKNEFTNFSNSYDSLNLNKIQFSLSASFKKYFPIWNKSTILTGIKFRAKWDNENLLDNEKFKIGGSQELRGFDEESILASVYGLINLEYRLLLSQNSYLSFPFIDFGMIKASKSNNNWIPHYGIGGGLSFETTAGLFNFSVAIGKTEDLPFDLQRPKVHFGYLNIF